MSFSIETDFFSDLPRSARTGKFPLSWEVINIQYSSLCENILGLFDLILTLPAASTDPERGFSTTKKIKNEFRTNMTDETLSDQLTIALVSPDEEKFDPSKAINLWNSRSTRGKDRLGIVFRHETRSKTNLFYNKQNLKSIYWSLFSGRLIQRRASRAIEAGASLVHSSEARPSEEAEKTDADGVLEDDSEVVQVEPDEMAAENTEECNDDNENDEAYESDFSETEYDETEIHVLLTND